MSWVKLFFGDCLIGMESIAANSIDLVLSDPPYGTTACKWDTIIPFEPMWKSLKKITKTDAAVVLFGSEPFSSMLRASNIGAFKYDWYWQRDRASNFLNARRQPLRNIEVISVFQTKKYFPIMDKWGEPSHSIGKAEGKISGESTQGRRINVAPNTADNLKFPRTLLYFKVPHPPIHPTQKPVALMEYLIKTYTSEGETVVDFTMGSGTTGVACCNLNRNFIGIENNEKYFKIAEKRIAEAKTYYNKLR